MEGKVVAGNSGTQMRGMLGAFALVLCCLSMHIHALSQKAILAGSFSSDGFDGIIRIGAPISFQLDDKFFSYGTTMSNSWNMFVEWVNQRGGVQLNGLSYSVSIQYVEDFSKAEYVAEICDYLTNMTKMDFMFGPYSSSLTETCKNLTDARDTLLLSGGASTSELFSNSELLFGTLPGDYEYAR